MTNDLLLGEIRSALTADREALRAAVDRVPAARRQQRPSTDRWSVAEILEHLSIVESRSAAALAPRVLEAPMLEAAAVSTVSPALRTSVLDRSRRITAPDFITPTGTLDVEAAWTALERSRQQVLSLLDAAIGRDLSTISRPHPVLGQMDGYQWLASIGGHEARHTAQILEIADQFAV